MQSISDNIKYIGAEDDNLDLFEGQYPVPAGISYNSFLIIDDESSIVDAVDVRRCHDWLAAIDAAIQAGAPKPSRLIVQHVEPDHSGSIGRLIDRFPEIRISCTAKAASMLSNFFEDINFSSRCDTVGDGDTLSFGSTTLRFITAPMVHWPEVMVTLDTTRGVLFSADAFGSFAMSTSTDAWDAEARRYYTNIVGRFGPSVQTLMKKLSKEKFSVIAPLHGPALKDNLPHYWNLYDRWSRYEPECRGTLVAYASIYGGTAEAARRIAAALEADNAGEVVLIDLSRHNVSYAVSEAFRLSSMVLCCATYDAGLLPSMHDFLYHIESKKLCNRTVGLIENGSWAPAAARLMADVLGRMKGMTIVEPVISIKSRLHHSDIPSLLALAEAIARS